MANKFIDLLKQINKRLEDISSRKEVMSINDLAAYTGWTTSYLYQLTRKRQIPFYRPSGKTIFFRRSEIEDWIFQHRVATGVELLQNHNVASKAKYKQAHA